MNLVFYVFSQLFCVFLNSSLTITKRTPVSVVTAL
nr:MAG TPA: hypothetical protein [Caudoviricetes sp.]